MYDSDLYNHNWNYFGLDLRDDECLIFFLISWNVGFDEVVNIFSRAKRKYFVLV